jgi:hypothetical protein
MADETYGEERARNLEALLRNWRHALSRWTRAENY